MRAASDIIIRNKKASHDYEFLEKYTAGIKLTGTEIKSIRAGKAALTDSFCLFREGELFIKGMHISEYWWGNLNNHDPLRERKLLLKARELRKIERKVKESGLTVIVIRVFINERGLAKAEIAVSKGKKEYDKRETLKRKDTERELDRLRKR
ncbi:MAG: SsrA-binding protein [Bacteroidetes bacterium RBG_13_42_15]|jgi:SsrA-binding protein|nr:MAG: SsrA-binding protein [Bacteroidetes bacterium RBG_13_42_15]